jgi:hypothetical protein
MRISFESSHVHGDFSSGRLTVGIGVEDAAAGLTTWDEIYFKVPADFHAHNDTVAAALMTLAGRKYSEVSFNFPISSFCADTLRAYYGDTGDIAFDPVDPHAAPRWPGARYGLNFSGGMDSTAAWLLLREALDGDFAVITSEYGGFFEFERAGYRHYHRDVSCRTDLRQKGYNQEGRFNFCVPLLFAEYLNLSGIVTGHGLAHSPDGLADHRVIERPPFLHGDLVVNAGGLADIHLLRPISATGVAMVIMALGRERIEAALAASTPPKSVKHYTGVLFFRLLYADAGLPVPQFLLDVPHPKSPAGSMSEHPVRMLYLIKRLGIAEVRRLCPEWEKHDLTFLDDLTLNYLSRYNTRLIELLPRPLRERAASAYRACGIEPYDERDWEEAGIVRRFLKQHVPRYKSLDD